MAVTLAQLLVATTQDEIRTSLLQSLASSPAKFPTTDWEALGPERAMVEIQSSSLYDLVASAQPTIIAGGFNDYATTDWLTLYSDQTYSNTRVDARRTIGSILLTNASTSTYTIGAGKLRAVSVAGNSYLNTGTGTLNPGSSLAIVFQSEFPNDSTVGRNYNDGANTILTLTTPLPGVSITNPAPTFSGVAHTGTGTGAITPSATDSILNNVVQGTTIKITILTTGQVAAGSLKYSVNSGPDVTVTPIPATLDIAGKDIRITFTNVTNPSFIIGDVYAFQTPGTWYTQQGTDQEADNLLQQRNRARWSTLSLVPTDGLYTTWARTADPTVTKVLVAVDLAVANQVNITLAGPAGPTSASAVANVQAFVNPRKPLTDKPIAASAGALNVVLSGGTITVDATKQALAQQTAQQNLQNYIDAAPIGGYLPGNLVSFAKVLGAISSVDGVIDVIGLLVNGGTIDLTLTSTQVAVFAQNIATALTWNPV